jgi:hypothetical protein
MTRLNDEELARFVDLATGMIGLRIPEELRAGVLENARIIAGHASLVMGCDIPPETEIAPEYRP